MRDHIAVVGSLNRDTVVRVARLPARGETVPAIEVTHHRGGKGANQAVAAARLGCEVALIGKVGADGDGTGYLRALVQEGIDVEGVQVDIDAPTGQAFILLDGRGENSIAVVAGANGRLGAEEVAIASSLLEDAKVVLAQLEVPLEAVKAAARLSGGTFVLNPSPAQALGPELLSLVDVLVVNRTELARLAAGSVSRRKADVVRQAKQLEVDAVVATLGGDGAIAVHDGSVTEVEAPVVDAVDTTGAGDAFCGGLADALGRGEVIEDAVRWAVAVGAVATTKVGAQTALPTADRVRNVLGDI